MVSIPEGTGLLVLYLMRPDCGMSTDEDGQWYLPDETELWYVYLMRSVCAISTF